MLLLGAVLLVVAPHVAHFGPAVPLAALQDAGPLDATRLSHLALVTADFDSATSSLFTVFGEELGAGSVSDDDWVWYRGSFTSARVRSASLRLGVAPTTFGLELVSPVDRSPSFWRELLDDTRFGAFFHHTGIEGVTNLTETRAALAGLGCETVQQGGGGSSGSCYAMVDCRATLGAVLELRAASGTPCAKPVGGAAATLHQGAASASALPVRIGVATAAAGRPPLLNISLVNHQCLVTSDFNRTADAWSHIFGVAAPVGGLSPKAWQYYRGQLTNASVTLVKTPIGSVPSDPEASGFAMELVSPR